MNIGYHLKQVRLLEKKSLKDFCEGICSVSFLSKVENGTHRISAEDLLLLLSKNNIDYVDFFREVFEVNFNDNTSQINTEIQKAYYSDNLLFLKNFLKELPSTKLKNRKYYLLTVTVLIYRLEGRIQDLPSETVDELKELIFLNQDWNLYNIGILANVFMLYDSDIIESFITQILHKYPLESSPINVQIIISSLILNVISLLLESKKIYKAQNYLFLLKRIQITPELAFQKLMINFYQNLINFISIDSDENKNNLLLSINIFNDIELVNTYQEIKKYTKSIIGKAIE